MHIGKHIKNNLMLHLTHMGSILDLSNRIIYHATLFDIVSNIENHSPTLNAIKNHSSNLNVINVKNLIHT